MIVVPCFANGTAPDAATLGALQTLGLIPPGVSVYAGADDYSSRSANLPGPPKNDDEDPQYFCDMNRVVPIGTGKFSGRIKPAKERSLFENRMYSSEARAFLDERPNWPLPEMVEQTPNWQNLNFVESGIGDPVEYPLGAHWGPESGMPEYQFPNVVLGVDPQGRFVVYTVDEAKRKFPLTPQMPTGPGADVKFSAEQYIALAKAMNKSTAVRSQAKDIYSGGQDAQTIAMRLENEIVKGAAK